jgi:serine/threonine protein phosphatase PrpC
MSYSAFSATVIGGSHTKHGKECQDFSLHSATGGFSLAFGKRRAIRSLGSDTPPLAAGIFYYPPDGKESPLSLAVIADGHGSEDNFRSARGAEIAAKCAEQGIADFYKAHRSKPPDSGEFDKMLRDLATHIVARWQISVEEDYTKNPFTPEELEKADEKQREEYEAGKALYKAYGTTLIAAALTCDYWFAIHIGDGRLTALYADGTFDQPVPWDERCYLNVTSSVCDEDAAERARVYFSFHAEKEPPCAVFLCSDGVDDNYPVDENEKHLFYKVYRKIALAFAEDGFELMCGEDGKGGQIKDLCNSFATNGKGDDTSIAGIIDMETLKNVVPSYRKQIAEEAKKTRAEYKKTVCPML